MGTSRERGNDKPDRGFVTKIYDRFSRAFFRSDQLRSEFDYEAGVRADKKNRIGLVLATTLLIFMGAFVVLIGWQREFADAYLATNIGIKSFDNAKQKWYVTSIRQSECGNIDDCYLALREKGLKIRSYDELTKPWNKIDTEIADAETVFIFIKTTINRMAWKELYDAGQQQLMIGMPTAWFDEAAAFVNGKLAGRFVDNSRVGVPINLSSEPQDLIVEMVYQKKWHYTGVFDPDDEPLLVTSPVNYRAWVRVLVMRSTQRGSWISNLSFIVMAIFFLLLYLFVDRSPEVLGLALFVGLDALSRSLWYDWLPISFTPQIMDTADSAAQIMRLYFLLQLARLGAPNVGPWLLVSFIYAMFASAGSWFKALGWQGIEDHVYEINVWCSLIVAFLGVVIAGFASVRVRKLQLPWRQWALLIAAVACVLQAVAYINNIFPALSNYPEFYKIRSIIVPLSVFLLASSAFVNISTLENRVRVLSKAKAKNDEIERELELGRVVQNAYMKVPNLPPEIDMACFFEAAFYVSGDAYFVHYDPDTKRLAVILGDMTGHGVHAALKATTLQVIARTIFRDSMRRSDGLGVRFIVYEQALRSFLRDSWNDGDLPTFLGIELDLATGVVVSHRANFPFPMIVEQEQSGRWKVKVWSDKIQSIDSRSQSKNIFFISASDGLVGGSKIFNRIATNLQKRLNELEVVNASVIKSEMLQCANEVNHQAHDDRTMVVFGLKNSLKVA